MCVSISLTDEDLQLGSTYRPLFSFLDISRGKRLAEFLLMEVWEETSCLRQHLESLELP